METQGTQCLPFTIFCTPNFYLCKNTSLSKTQGLPLVLISPKPKVHPQYIFLLNPRFALGTYLYRTRGTPSVRLHVATTMTIVKGPSSTKRTTTPLFCKTFNQVKTTPTPHNHQRSKCRSTLICYCDLITFLFMVPYVRIRVKNMFNSLALS